MSQVPFNYRTLPVMKNWGLKLEIFFLELFLSGEVYETIKIIGNIGRKVRQPNLSKVNQLPNDANISV